MSLKIGSVWIRADGQELLVPADSVQAGDEVIVRMSNVIPFDGEVCAGEGMVNQSSLTGESVPVDKYEDAIDSQDTALGDRRNMLFSSSLVTYGR
jgi:P-type E1-E2 ATPase